VKEGEEIVEVMLVSGNEVVITATRGGRVLLCKVDEINFLGGPGRGVKVMKVGKNDRVIGFTVSRGENEGLIVIRDNGKRIPILPKKYRVTSRAGKGFEVIKRGSLAKILRPEVTLPEFLNPEAVANGNGRGKANGKNGNQNKE
jgi:DNA gyrase subunit A